MRASLLLASILLALGCGRPADTRCGQTLDDSRATWVTAEGLQAAEDAFVSAALLLAGDDRVSTPGEACMWLEGTKVVLMPDPTFVDDFGRSVAGIAYSGRDWTLTAHAPGGVVIVGRQDEGGWKSSALVHEWLHVVEGGVPAALCAPTDGPHCGWGRPGGEYALIDALR